MRIPSGRGGAEQPRSPLPPRRPPELHHLPPPFPMCLGPAHGVSSASCQASRGHTASMGQERQAARTARVPSWQPLASSPRPAPSAPLPSAHYFSAFAMCSSASLIFCAAISPARRAGLGRAPPPPCAAVRNGARITGTGSSGRSGPGPACSPRLRRGRGAPSAGSAAGRPRERSPGRGLCGERCGALGCAATRGRRAPPVHGPGPG